MELKKYQKDTLRDLAQYIDVLNDSNSLSVAYAQYWEKKGVRVNEIKNEYLRPYINSVNSVPRVTLKVPTAGGKTFIACNAIKTIMDGLKTDAPNKVVAWFVPSDTILKQTLEKLQDVTHPYRQILDALFCHRVVVVDKEAALMGQGISPANMRENLTIFVLSAQSFVETIRSKKEKSSEQSKPRVYRENGNFIEHVGHYTNPENLIEGTDPTALIQVIAQQHPLVVVDESHNFKADLRVEMLNNISPRFILELTATPRENSNIISFVDAMQLKKENMVKLPVIVENRNSAKDVLLSAIRMRDSLEEHAKALRQQGGRYIRPIVLFQAQPKTDDDNITFDKIKNNLIGIGIPEEQIKIKTANKDELKGLDLMSELCPVRYIITVNALKEGWDCPFAYILATLANKSSVVDVEQILGRILRQPYAMNHNNALLNISYVFTSSNDFRQTVDKIISSLQKAGFSRKDFREIEKAAPTQPSPLTMRDLFGNTEADNVPPEIDDTSLEDLEVFTCEEMETIKEDLNVDKPNTDIVNLQEQATQFCKEYEKKIEEDSNNEDPLVGVMPTEKFYNINVEYQDVISEITLPIFYKKTTPSLFSEEEWIPLEKSMLSEGFKLSTKDTEVDFTIVRPQGTTIDIAESGDSYVPVRRTHQQALDLIRSQYVDRSATSKKNLLANQIAHMIDIDNIPEADIKNYVSKVIESRDEDEITSLVDNIYNTRDAIQKKIESLLKTHQAETFKYLLDISHIETRPHFVFLDKIYFTSRELLGLEKGLYVKEEYVNNFEYDVISAIAENPNVFFWHRNLDRKGFCLNGFINHYPDFIVRMKSGKTILVETKGDHLVNDDSLNKIKIGRKWADLSGKDYHYFMVFENKEVEGAITVKQLLQYLNEL